MSSEVKITIEDAPVKRKLSQFAIFSRKIFHALAFCEYIFVLGYGLVIVRGVTEDLLADEKIWNTKYLAACYLTNWNVLFQTTFLCLAVGHDVLEWMDRNDSELGRLVKYWRDVVFSGLVVPITVFVALMFWSLYSIDRELVFPAVYDQIVPWWFNHCVHTNILVIVGLETLLQPRRKPVDSNMEHICVMTVLVSYAVVYYSIYFISHRWLYQVFGILNWWQVCLYQCGIWVSSYCFYRLQYPVNRLIHGSSDDEEQVEKTNNNGDVNHITDVDQDKVDGHMNGDVVAISNGVASVIEHGNKEEGAKKMIYKNGTLERKNSLKRPPFADRSWSLKYRTLRSKFENASL